MSTSFVVGFLALGVWRCYEAGCSLMARRMFKEVVTVGVILSIIYFAVKDFI